jgi:hypothetical protein
VLHRGNLRQDDVYSQPQYEEWQQVATYAHDGRSSGDRLRAILQ